MTTPLVEHVREIPIIIDRNDNMTDNVSFFSKINENFKIFPKN